LFDLANSEPSAIMRARRAAADVVVKLQPSDLVAVATYNKMKAQRLGIRFPADRKQIAIALDSLGNTDMFDRSGDPLALALADLQAQFGLGEVGKGGGGVAAGGGGGGKGGDEALENLRDAARASDKADRANRG